MTSRGVLIVLEGCDRAGKTTQAKKLVDALNQLGRATKLIKFPGKYPPYVSLSEDPQSSCVNFDLFYYYYQRQVF